MSGYGNLRKRTHEAATGETDTTRCIANGCPCKGSVSHDGSRFMCSAHAAVPSDRWPMVTERLRDHAWLIEFIDEVQKMDRNPPKRGELGWRAFSTQFWSESDAFCVPRERENAVPYQLRMRGELLHRCGVMARRPEPRLPQEPQVRRFGNAGGLVGGAA